MFWFEINLQNGDFKIKYFDTNLSRMGTGIKLEKLILSICLFLCVSEK